MVLVPSKRAVVLPLDKDGVEHCQTKGDLLEVGRLRICREELVV